MPTCCTIKIKEGQEEKTFFWVPKAIHVSASLFGEMCICKCILLFVFSVMFFLTFYSPACSSDILPNLADCCGHLIGRIRGESELVSTGFAQIRKPTRNVGFTMLPNQTRPVAGGDRRVGSLRFGRFQRQPRVHVSSSSWCVVVVVVRRHRRRRGASLFERREASREG